MTLSRLWKLSRYGNGGKQTAFSTVTTALGKLAKERRVFHSFHSPYDYPLGIENSKRETKLSTQYT